jgi:hypothetical protein
MVSKTTIRNRNKILKCLAEARAEGTEFLWLRSIARRTGINLGTVNWIVYRYLFPDFVEFPQTDELIEQGLRIRPIRLLDEVFEKMTGVAASESGEAPAESI